MSRVWIAEDTTESERERERQTQSNQLSNLSPPQNANFTILKYLQFCVKCNVCACMYLYSYLCPQVGATGQSGSRMFR